MTKIEAIRELKKRAAELGIDIKQVAFLNVFRGNESNYTVEDFTIENKILGVDIFPYTSHRE